MKRILVVEDDDGTREALLELFRDAGYAPLGARSGDEALALIRRTAPDVLLLDLLLPRMDGWQLLAHLAQDRELARLPKIVMTALPSPIHLPGVPIVRKPFDWNALLGIVRRKCGPSVAKCPARLRTVTETALVR
jgi:CheY-like chemotaxis protein